MQTESPIDPSSLTRWRKRIGEDGVEKLLMVTIATTLKEGLVVGMRSMPGNPWEGHTLEETIEQVSILTEHKPTIAIVDKGYVGVPVDGVQVLRSGQRRGLTSTMKKMIKRHSAIEPTRGHMKMDGRLARNSLKGAFGDAVHAVM